MSDTSLLLFDPENVPGLGPNPRPGRWSLSEVERHLAAWPDWEGLPAERRDWVRASALLWHDHLDAAHEIVQDHAGGEGAYLHGIMHRREPDYWNAKYWFRRVSPRPVLAFLGHQLASLPDAEAFVADNGFDPARFVDAVEEHAHGRGRWTEAGLRTVQAAEFRALLAHLRA